MSSNGGSSSNNSHPALSSPWIRDFVTNILLGCSEKNANLPLRPIVFGSRWKAELKCFFMSDSQTSLLCFLTKPCIDRIEQEYDQSIEDFIKHQHAGSFMKLIRFHLANVSDCSCDQLESVAKKAGPYIGKQLYVIQCSQLEVVSGGDFKLTTRTDRALMEQEAMHVLHRQMTAIAAKDGIDIKTFIRLQLSKQHLKETDNVKFAIFDLSKWFIIHSNLV